MIDDVLVEVWRYDLTDKQKYVLWFKHFNAGDQARLWNKLTFAREWFRRVIGFSKQQAGVGASLLSKRKKEEIADDNMIRHDIYTMLKTLSKRMFDAGITDEEILLQKYSSYKREDKDKKFAKLPLF